MGINGDLMRMLEPAIRPDGVHGVAPGKRNQPHVPFEKQSFEMMLEEAQGDLSQDDSQSLNGAQKDEGRVDVLGGLNQVHNASLANLIANHANSQTRDEPEQM